MRVLISSQDRKQCQHLKKIFEGAGYNVDIWGYKDPIETRDYITDSSELPFDLVVYDAPLASEEMIGGVPARLAIETEAFKSKTTGEFQACAMQVISDDDTPDTILKNAALEIGYVFDKSSNGIITADGFELNLMDRTVKVDGKDLKVTSMEFKILQVLTLYKGLRLSAKEIEQIVYDDELEKSDRIVGMHIRNLKKKIKETAGEKFIIKNGSSGVNGYILPGIPIVKRFKDIQFGNITLNTRSREMICNKKVEILTPRQVAVLNLLQDKREKSMVLLMERLNISHITVKSIVSRIRDKISNISGENYIRTIRGKGFQLMDEPVPKPSRSIRYPVISKPDAPAHTSPAP